MLYIRRLTATDKAIAYYLQERLVISLAERARQVNAFKDVNSTVEKDLRTKWQSDITAWLADTSKPNPYILDKSGASIQ